MRFRARILRGPGMGRTLQKSLLKGLTPLVLAVMAGLAAAFADPVSLTPDDDLRGLQADEAGEALPTVAEPSLYLCPRMRVANAPAADAERRVLNFAPIVEVNGLALATNPTTGACLSSAFGRRGSGMHRGLDYYSATGGPISAGADGVVLERVYRNDYGNMLLIDHGNGVYTRYAHLASFADGVEIGAHVSAGQKIGMMGNTAAYRVPVHLHYEVLLGDYDNPRGSFGLEARSPFAFAPPIS